ncbi:MAG: hypothetical protein ACXABG_12250 [Promethearchaeota archaeon]|jgi:hypothetical protein
MENLKVVSIVVIAIGAFLLVIGGVYLLDVFTMSEGMMMVAPTFLFLLAGSVLVISGIIGIVKAYRK